MRAQRPGGLGPRARSSPGRGGAGPLDAGDGRPFFFGGGPVLLASTIAAGGRADGASRESNGKPRAIPEGEFGPDQGESDPGRHSACGGTSDGAGTGLSRCIDAVPEILRCTSLGGYRTKPGNFRITIAFLVSFAHAAPLIETNRQNERVRGMNAEHASGVAKLGAFEGQATWTFGDDGLVTVRVDTVNLSANQLVELTHIRGSTQ